MRRRAGCLGESPSSVEEWRLREVRKNIGKSTVEGAESPGFTRANSTKALEGLGCSLDSCNTLAEENPGNWCWLEVAKDSSADELEKKLGSIIKTHKNGRR